MSIPGSALLLFQPGMNRFTIHIFDLMNDFNITESTLRLEIGKCSGEQYPPAACSCYISKAGTLSGLDPSTLIHD